MIQDTRKMKEIIEETLNNEKITGIKSGPFEVIKVKGGKTYNSFVVTPNLGLSKIKRLTDDLAIALGESKIRVVPDLESHAIAIEVTNEDNCILRVEDLIDSKAFRDSKANNGYKIPVVLGFDDIFTPYIADLASLKSILVINEDSGNFFVESILESAKRTDRDIKIVRIDTTNPAATRDLEMMVKMCNRNRNRDCREFENTIVIVDELSSVIEWNAVDNLIRLFRGGHLVNIYPIIITRFPYRDIILEELESFTRVVFQISSGLNAKRIGVADAEKLSRNGDMLVYMPGHIHPIRLTAPNAKHEYNNDNLSEIEDIDF